jgi:hypothetical protein
MDGIMSMAHKGLVVYQVNRDSTAIPVREEVRKKEGKAVKKQGRLAKNTPKAPQEPTVIER